MSTYIRLATPEDVPILRELINASVRELQAGDYTAAQIDGALRTVFGVDSQLIADGTYLVAEVRDRVGRAFVDDDVHPAQRPVAQEHMTEVVVHR